MGVGDSDKKMCTTYLISDILSHEWMFHVHLMTLYTSTQLMSVRDIDKTI